MNFISKISSYIKYNLKDKWEFIYLEKLLDDSIFTLNSNDKELIIRIADNNDIIRIKNDIFPYLTEAEIKHDGKYINRIGEGDLLCFIGEKNEILVHYFLVYKNAACSPLAKTPFNNALICHNDAYLGTAFTNPDLRGHSIVLISLSSILLYLRDTVKANRVYVLVHKDTLGAEDFYKRLGFNIVNNPVRKRYLNFTK